MKAQEFWEEIFSQGQAGGYSRVEMPDRDDPVLNAALAHFGDVAGRTLLDLGCGRGASSLFFGSHGARVISIDASPTAIRNLSAYCAAQGIEGITPLCMPALKIGEIGTVDLIFGSMILHHIEPFGEFVPVLRDLLAEDGRAFFFENSARSSLMIWFRQHVVGRFGVPKYGDEEEFPLTRAELEMLRRCFRVRVEHPELVFFRMIPRYLLRNHFRRPFERLDELCYRVPALRRYSYHQYLYLS